MFQIVHNFSRKDEDGEEKEEGEVVEPHPLVSISDINPEDIPEVPTNKFLMRGGETKFDDKRGGKWNSVDITAITFNL